MKVTSTVGFNPFVNVPHPETVFERALTREGITLTDEERAKVLAILSAESGSAAVEYVQALLAARRRNAILDELKFEQSATEGFRYEPTTDLPKIWTSGERRECK